MTREEFIDGVSAWSELMNFCYEVCCDICEDIYDEDSRDEYINDNLIEMAAAKSWQDFRDELYDIPTGYYYYVQDGYGDWEGLDDSDFESYKEDVLRWGDDEDIWDEEEIPEEYDDGSDEDEDDCGNNEDEDDYEEDDDDDDTPIEEDLSLEDLLIASVSTTQQIIISKKEQEEREIDTFNNEFSNFISQIKTIGG